MADGVVALLWLGVPLVAWLLIARTREVGLPVAVVLTLGLGAGTVLTAAGVLTRGRLELGIGYAVAATILVVLAMGGQEEKAASAAESTLRAVMVFSALTAVVLQFGLALLGAIGVFILGLEAEIPTADGMPAVPAGFTAVGDDDESCGSGSCYRTRTYDVGPDVPEDEMTRLVQRSECRPNGWLLDRRERCTSYRLSGDQLIVTVSLADRLQ